VILNENEHRLLNDITRAVENFVPDDEDYEHDAIDDNAAAHLQATVLGESVTVPVVEGELDLGKWQSILFVECDGPRTRRVSVTVIDG
jgi:secondary thiamine-phosphate synthase enzyme